MITLPCVNPQCGTPIPLPVEERALVCPQCQTVREMRWFYSYDRWFRWAVFERLRTGQGSGRAKTA